LGAGSTTTSVTTSSRSLALVLAPAKVDKVKKWGRKIIIIIKGGKVRES